MNIAEIAKRAGVSSAAVSRYFNDGYISEEKREKIRRVVEETGYRPSVQAQTLRTKKTKMIGVIVPKVASASIGRVVEGILSVLNGRKYQMLLAVTQNDPEKELEYLDAFSEKQVDGVILVATVFSARHKKVLKNMPVPVVLIGQQLSGCCCVYHDDYHASYDLTKYILETGRKKVGYLGAIWQDKAVGEERYKGFHDALEDAGLEEYAQNYVISAFTVASGYEKCGELLEKCGELDGIICATDTMGAGAVKCLRERGIEVPKRTLVAGQGDSDMAGVMAPPLLTVHYSYEKSGEIAAEMLMEILHQGKTDLKEIKLGYHLVK